MIGDSEKKEEKKRSIADRNFFARRPVAEWQVF